MRWRCLAIVFLPVLLAAPVTLARDEASTRRWREDVAFLRAEMPRLHKNLFHSMPREEFDRMVDALSARVPWLEDHEIAVEIGRIVTRVGDGHTRINFSQPSLGFRILPIRLHPFSDGMFIRQAIDPSLAGAKVLRIGDLAIGEAVRRMTAVAPRDNESGLRVVVALQLGVPEILHALRIAPSKDRVTLRVEQNGGTRDVELVPMAMRDAMAAMMRPESGDLPFYRRHADRNFWFEPLPAARAVYVKYNAVRPQGPTTPARFFDEIFAYADAHAVETLVIDVRNNGGGDNTLNLPIIHGLIRRERLKVFALIGRETFSAAQNFVNLLEKHTSAIFAGEPTGSRPNHYGDAVPVRLPHSGLEVRVSSLWWQDVHPADSRSATLPHLAVEMSSADYFAGRDPVLEAVLRAASTGASSP